LLAYAEACSLRFVVKEVTEVLVTAKSPKVVSDGLMWISTALIDFGIGGIRMRELVDAVKSHLESSNAAVRTNAIYLLGILRMYLGPSLRKLVEDVKPALLSLIDAEFAKVTDQTPPAPTRVEHARKQANINGSTKNSDDRQVVATAEEEGELFPRTDISVLITSNLLKVSLV
jgi:cytoskeleton-associated protein 5